MTRTPVPIAIVLAGLLVACGAAESPAGESRAPGSSTPVATVEPIPPEDCVNPPGGITDLIQQDEPLACYGDATLTVDAALTGPGAIDCPGDLQPAWFGCTSAVFLRPIPETGHRPDIILAARSPEGGELYAVLHPEIEALRPRLLRPGLMDMFLVVTGHYDDPAAHGCRYEGWPDAGPPTAEQAIHQCRLTFVITAVAPWEPSQTEAAAPPPKTPVPNSGFQPGNIGT